MPRRAASLGRLFRAEAVLLVGAAGFCAAAELLGLAVLKKWFSVLAVVVLVYRFPILSYPIILFFAIPVDSESDELAYDGPPAFCVYAEARWAWGKEVK